MNRKPIVVFMLAMGVALAAQAAVSHHRAAIIGRAIFEHLRTIPATNEAADSSKAEPAGSAAATGAATTAAQAIEVPAGTTLTVRLGVQVNDLQAFCTNPIEPEKKSAPRLIPLAQRFRVLK